MQEIKNKINITDYSYLTIAEISELIRLQKVSPLELVTGCLERIERFNPTLNAFITVIYDEALKNAREAEKEINRWAKDVQQERERILRSLAGLGGL